MIRSVHAKALLSPLFDLGNRLPALRQDFSRSGGRPWPKECDIYQRPDPSSPSGMVRLFSGALNLYPLELQGIRYNDDLFASYTCYQPDGVSVNIGLSYGELTGRERDLQATSLLRADTIAQWNLFQVRAGLLFMDLLPEDADYGLPEHIVQDFFRSQEAFRQSAGGWVETSLLPQLRMGH